MAAGVRGGHVPFGYRRIAKGAYAPDPGTAPVVPELFRGYRDGRSVRRLVAELTARGVSGATGKLLSWDQARYLLSNRFYLGELRWRVPADLQEALGEEIRITDHHPPLVDLVLFDEVQRDLERRRRGNRSLADSPATPARGRRHRRHVPLAEALERSRLPGRPVHGILPPGAVVCGGCGGRIYARLDTRGSRNARYRVPVYECETHKSRGKDICAEKPVLVADIDEEVEERLLTAVRGGRWREVGVDGLPADTTGIDAELAALAERRTRLAAACDGVEGTAARDQLEQRLAELDRTGDELCARRERALREGRRATGPRWELLRDVEAWTGFDLATRREVAGDLVDRAVITGKRLVVCELASPSAGEDRGQR